MIRPILELRDIASLVAIAETGSISAAARKLNLTQPALSASLRRLEADLRVRLVTRHSRGATLTPEGAFVLEKAYGLFQDVAEIESVSNRLAGEPTGLVRVGLPTTVAGGLVPELVPRLRLRYPHVRLHVVEAMSGVLMDLLQLGRLDLAVLFDVQPMPGLRSEPILTEELKLLVPAGHRFGGRETIPLAEAVAQELVLPSRDNSIRRHIEACCQAEGLRLDVSADVDSLPGLVNLVKVGHATILPTFVVEDALSAGGVHAAAIVSPALAWTLHLASRRDASRPMASMAAGRILIESCIDLVDSGRWPGRRVA